MNFLIARIGYVRICLAPLHLRRATKRVFLIVSAGSLIFSERGFASTKTCEQLLAKAGTLGANVSKYYTRVKISVDSRGELQIPRGTKAFAYWRERTPSWIPDSAFAFQYLEHDQWKQSVVLAGRAVLDAEIASHTVAKISTDAKTSPGNHNNKSNHDKIIPSPLDQLGIVSLSTLLSEIHATDWEYFMKYLIFKDKEELIIITLPTNWSHESVADKILKGRPDLKLVGGDSLGLHLEFESPDGRMSQMHGSIGGARMDFIHYDLSQFMVDSEFFLKFREHDFIKKTVLKEIQARTDEKTILSGDFESDPFEFGEPDPIVETEVVPPVNTSPAAKIIPSDLAYVGIMPLEQMLEEHFQRSTRTFTTKYIILARGAETFCIAHPEVWSHEAVAAKIINQNPDIKLVTGNYVSVIGMKKSNVDQYLDYVKILPGMARMSFIDYDLSNHRVDSDFFMTFEEDNFLKDQVKNALKGKMNEHTEFVFGSNY